MDQVCQTKAQLGWLKKDSSYLHHNYFNEKKLYHQFKMFFKEKQPTKPETIIATLSTFSLCYVFLYQIWVSKLHHQNFNLKVNISKFSNQMSNQSQNFKPYEKIATKYQLFKRCFLHHLDHPDDPSPMHNFHFKRKLSPIPDEYYDNKNSNKNNNNNDTKVWINQSKNQQKSSTSFSIALSSSIPNRHCALSTASFISKFKLF